MKKQPITITGKAKNPLLQWVLAAWIVAVFTALDAGAMNLTSPPTKFSIPWANAPVTNGPYLTFPIPTPSQIGVAPCVASLTDGFPPLTFQSISAGGCGPRGQDFNGILKMITLWNQWFAAGAIPLWDSSYQTSILGYPLGALVSQSAQTGCYWANTLDANTSNPDSSGANWTSACPGGGLATAASTGSANAQIVAATPFLFRTGAITLFNPGFTASTGIVTLNVNGSGAIDLAARSVGGFFAGNSNLNIYVAVIYDGTYWEGLSSSSYAFLTVPDQTLTGGANVTSNALAFASSINVDCGLNPLQYVPNTGSMTINAPVNDSSCFLQIENGAGAAIPTLAGFTNGSSLGDPLTATSGSKFVIHVWRIHGVPSYFIKALQ